MNVSELMKRVGENLSVQRAFGSAYEKDGVYLIPVALVAGGGGGGGSPIASAHPEADDLAASNDDAAGAGFGGVVLPVGAYVIKDGDVRWVPAVNVTLIALGALGVVRLLLRTVRRHHR